MEGLNKEISGQNNDGDPIIEIMREDYSALKDFLKGLTSAQQEEFKIKAAEKLALEKESLSQLERELQELKEASKKLLAKATQSQATQDEQSQIFPELMKVMERMQELSAAIQAKNGKIALWSLEID